MRSYIQDLYNHCRHWCSERIFHAGTPTCRPVWTCAYSCVAIGAAHPLPLTNRGPADQLLPTYSVLKLPTCARPPTMRPGPETVAWPHAHCNRRTYIHPPLQINLHYLLHTSSTIQPHLPLPAHRRRHYFQHPAALHTQGSPLQCMVSILTIHSSTLLRPCM